MREHQLLPGGSGIILAVWHLHSSISSMLRRLPGLQVHFKLCTHGQNVRQHLPFQRKKASNILPMCMFAFCRTCMLKNQQLIGVFWPVGGVPLSEHNSSAGEIAGLTSHGKCSVSDRSCPNPAGCRKKKKKLGVYPALHFTAKLALWYLWKVLQQPSTLLYNESCE